MESLGGGSDRALVYTFAAFEALFTPSAMLPSIMTIGTFVDSEDKVRMIRQGELFSTIFNLAFGVMLAWVMGTPVPLFIVLGATAGVMGVYEYALRSAPAWREAQG